MWLTGILAGRKVAVAVVYLWTGAHSRETNIELIKCIEKDYHNIGRPTIKVGDFNAHLEEFDGRTDGNGKLLQDMAEHLDMVIVNTQDKFIGTTTWTARGMSSTIDYCQVSPDLYEKLNYMEIDEEGDKSLGSDHNRLLITFGGKPTEKRVSEPMRPHHITQAEAQTIAHKLEEKVETRQVQTGRPREDAVIKDNATGKELDSGKTNWYIERWIGDMFTGDSRQMDSEEGETEDELQEQPSREEITERKLKRAVKRMGGTTATGTDGIPMRLVKELGPEMRALLREILNQILKEGWVPVEKQTGRRNTSILECTGIKPDVTYEPDMAVALGFRGINEQYAADSSRPVEVTKRRLECWWRGARDHNYDIG
ncbi:hypothetical protein ISCGN_029622 [Ixodes scapularis]